MTLPEPQPYTDPDRYILCNFIGQSLANPKTVLSCSSSTVIDRELQRTGRRAWRIVIETTCEDLPAPAPPADGILTVGRLRMGLVAADYLRHAHTADDAVVVQQEHSLDTDDLEVIKSKITITAKGNEDISQYGAKMLAAFPLFPGFSRKFYNYVPTYDPESPRGIRVLSAVVEITDKKNPPRPDPDGFFITLPTDPDAVL